MKYRVKTTCYFNQRLFEVGEVVDFAEGMEIPEHFEALEKAAPKKAAAVAKKAKK